MRKWFAFAWLLLVACRPSAPELVNNVQAHAPDEAATDTRPPSAPNAVEQAPPAATPVEETSGDAAAKIVERFAGLLEQRRIDEALRLWSDYGQSKDEFAAALNKYATIDATVGKPGDSEGAAGSIYVDVPLALSGKLKSGGRYSVSGSISLRRVNDVPGSTVEQRRWHIYAIDLKPAA
ncbi:MAG TPA: hypothetical protein VK485_07785 [Sphingomicrobium sp.]|nr:hypothetical protein [Sphingomicrobium sp.]